MRLHENKQLFNQAVLLTARQKQILEVYVEKDYWVTFALKTIFNNPIGRDTIFKGGTALLKCFNLIERFSEDIDLVVIRRDGESDSKLATKIRKIGNAISTQFPEINIEGITQKRGKNRKTAHAYSKIFEGEFGQIRNILVLESTWLGNFEP